jgi:hypothetical protein
LDEDGVKRNRFKRFWNFWKGPYFVKGMEGSNVVLQAFEKEKAITVHQNRVKRYIYPLRGLGAVGDARNGYLQSVLDHRKEEDGSIEYKVLWQLQRGQKVEWVDESLVPLNLVLDYFDHFGVVQDKSKEIREMRRQKKKQGIRIDEEGKMDLGKSIGIQRTTKEDDKRGETSRQENSGSDQVTDLVDNERDCGDGSVGQADSRTARVPTIPANNTHSFKRQQQQKSITGLGSSAQLPPRRSPRLAQGGGV